MGPLSAKEMLIPRSHERGHIEALARCAIRSVRKFVAAQARIPRSHERGHIEADPTAHSSLLPRADSALT